MIRALLRRLTERSAEAPSPPAPDAQPTAAGEAAAAMLIRIGLPADAPIDSAAIAATIGQMRSERPDAIGHPDAVVCDAAELVATLSCPDLAAAGDVSTGARSRLIQGISGLTGADSCPLASPALVARAGWAAARAMRWSEASHEPLYSQVRSTLEAMAHTLVQIGGEFSWLPGNTQVLDAFSDAPAMALFQALELDPVDADLDIADDWRAWSWRASGAAVAHGRVRRTASRLWVTSADSAFQWDWRSGSLLRASLSEPGSLLRARVDAPAFIGEIGTASMTRTITARKARVTVRDRFSSPVPIRWSLEPRWSIESHADGFVGTDGDDTLHIKLDPAWSWALEGHEIAGKGDADRIRCSFEVR